MNVGLASAVILTILAGGKAGGSGGINSERILASEEPISEIVITGIVNQTNPCVEEVAGTRVRIEACLIMQGAFGWWLTDCALQECADFRQLPSADPNTLQALFTLAQSDTRFQGALALGVANTVPILSNVLNRYYYLAFFPDYAQPGTDAELCLLVRHGVCGNQVAVAGDIATALALEARDIDFYYGDTPNRQSHTMIELHIADEWLLYDVTYGAYWPEHSGKFYQLPTTKL